MTPPTSMDRRQFLRLAGLGAAALGSAQLLVACRGDDAAAPGAAETTGATETPVTTGDVQLRVQIQEFAHDALQPFIEEFTDETGIGVTLEGGPAAGADQLSQLTPQLTAGSTPYDVISIADEPTPAFGPAGWLEPLDDVLDDEGLQDFPEDMRAYIDTWARADGALVKIPHGWEYGYSWANLEVLDAAGAEPPTTWEEVLALQEALPEDVQAFADAAALPGHAAVYAIWLAAQAGTDVFAFDDQVGEAFAHARELLDAGAYPRSALNWNYDQLNAAYMEDRLATMRQFPFFWDVGRENTEWFDERKAVVVPPPAGPGGSATWAGAWGWSIPAFTDHVDEAKEFVRFMTAPERSGPLAQALSWFLTPRRSALDVVGSEGLAQHMAEYSDLGVVVPRPFHPRVNDATTVVDEVFHGYLTGQLELDEALERGRDGIAALDS